MLSILTDTHYKEASNGMVFTFKLDKGRMQHKSDFMVNKIQKVIQNATVKKCLQRKITSAWYDRNRFDQD